MGNLYTIFDTPCMDLLATSDLADHDVATLYTHFTLKGDGEIVVSPSRLLQRRLLQRRLGLELCSSCTCAVPSDMWHTVQ